MDVRASTYWLDGGSLESAADVDGGQSVVWVDRVVAAIPCTAAHRVTIERLQPHPVALEGWDVGPVRATARVGSNRETVEVVFHGTIAVTFRDPDGESPRVRRSFQLRREMLVPPVPPSWRVHVQAGGSAGRGSLERVPGAIGFRGDVHLVALVHLTEPVPMRGLGGPRPLDPVPVPVIAPGSEEAGVPPVGPRRSEPVGNDRFHQGFVLEEGILFGPDERPAGQRNTGTPGTVRLQGIVTLPPDERPVTIETRPVPRPDGTGWVLRVEMVCEDRHGRRRTASWLVSAPPGLDDPDGALEVVEERWRASREGFNGAGGVRSSTGIIHTVWVRGVQSATRASLPAPSSPGFLSAESEPGAGHKEGAKNRSEDRAAGKGEGEDEGRHESRAESLGKELVEGIRADVRSYGGTGAAGEELAHRESRENEQEPARAVGPAAENVQGHAEPEEDGRAGAAEDRAKAEFRPGDGPGEGRRDGPGDGPGHGPGRTIVWRLPQPDAPPVPELVSSIRRPGSRDGSR